MLPLSRRTRELLDNQEVELGNHLCFVGADEAHSHLIITNAIHLFWVEDCHPCFFADRVNQI